MKKTQIIRNIIIIIFISFNTLANEVQFEATNMDITSDGNLVTAYDSKILIPTKNIQVTSQKAEYYKKKNLITLTGDVYFEDSKNNLIVEGKKINYEKEKDLIYSIGEAKIKIKNYDIKSENIFFDRKSGNIYSNKKTVIEDGENNLYFLEDKFNFETFNEIIKSKKSTIIDRNLNKYIFEDLVINLKNNEIAGREIKVEFEDSYFGNIKNDPLLKGKSGYSNADQLKVYKAVFSTCNINKKKCRGWELSTKEFNHDKQKKIFEYKDSWLKIFDYPIFFLPYFNHPDPTVKRKSGFLAPSYSTSQSLGTSINTPYCKVISEDKDITLNPRFYADKSFLLQNEYRQALESSTILNDFSFLIGEAGTKGHFFYNQIGKFDKNNEFQINLQNIKGDNYLKNHKLSDNSKLIKNDDLLTSNIDINWNFENSRLNTSFKIFEDLSRDSSDRYQYIFPDYNFQRNIKISNEYNGTFDFYSYGYNKNYDTNKTEAVLTNDFLFSSIDFINNKGISTNYKLLLKNSNDYKDYSTESGEKKNYNLYSTIKIDTSYPLRKKSVNFIDYFTPIASLRYSPNGNTDLSNKDISLNYDSVFGLDRINTSSEVEGGESLTLGMEFIRDNIEGYKVFDFKVANVLKLNEDIKLPTKSKLNKTRSDIFGSTNYNFNKNLGIGYKYSYNRDLKYSNLDELNLDFSINNFMTNFSYYTENNDLEYTENIRNTTNFNFNDENKFIFEIAKDLKEDFTEYYDLSYTYLTDCLSINFNYNKSFYRDGNLEPNKSLSFLIKIIPFTELGVPNVITLIGN